jgi:MarR family transcriptional regulator, 2-MHQ and catechol-resistance regulon repressor
MTQTNPVPNRDVAAHARLVLWRANKAVEALEIQHLQAQGLCLTDFAILEVLLHKGPLPVNDIGQKVLLTSGSITTAISRLQARKLVRREQCVEDRRVVRVHLTEAGTSFIRGHYTRHLDCLHRMTDILTAGEQAELVRLLKKLGLHAASLLEA